MNTNYLSKTQSLISYILAALLLLSGILGFSIYKDRGAEFRIASDQNNRDSYSGFQIFDGDTGHVQFHEYISNNFFPCQPKLIKDKSLTWDQYVRCAQSKNNPAVNIALLGDSHAEQLFIGLAESLPTKNVAFYIKGSPPYLSNPEFYEIYQHIFNTTSIEVVIIAMWQGRNGEMVPNGSTTAKELGSAVSKLEQKGKTVYLVEDIPQFPFEPARCKTKRAFSTRTPNCEVDNKSVKDFSSPYRGVLEIIVRDHPSVNIIDTQKYFCNSSVCSMVFNNKILYRNNNHLNIYGSKFIGSKIATQVSNRPLKK